MQPTWATSSAATETARPAAAILLEEGLLAHALARAVEERGEPKEYEDGEQVAIKEDDEQKHHKGRRVLSPCEAACRCRRAARRRGSAAAT